MHAAGSRWADIILGLARPTLRTMPWWQLVAGGGLAVLVVLGTVGSADLPMSAVVDRLRVASVLLAVGVAGVLDDPTRPHLDGTAVPLVARQVMRIVVALAVTAVWWTLVLLAAAYHPSVLRNGPRAGDVPVLALSVVLLAVVLVTLAAAAVVTRTRGGAGAAIAGGTAVAVSASAAVLPRLLAQLASVEVAMFPTYVVGREVDESGGVRGVGVDPVWLAAHQRWAAIAVVAAVVLAWALPGGHARRGRRRDVSFAGREPDRVVGSSTGQDGRETSR